VWLALVVVVVTAGTSVAVRWPAWGEMLVIVVGMYAMCKQVTWWRATRGGTYGAWWRQVAYLAAWPGMDARTFVLGSAKKRVTAREWVWATTKVMAGCALVWGVAGYAGGGVMSAWVAMIGLVMAFHFGIFHMLELVWRSAGVDAGGIMRKPLRSTSVGEFWGKRWNAAYRDLTHRFVFAPLLKVVPAWAAVLAGFLVSGLVHELVISVPARGGYGLPSLYFALQGGAVLLEKRMPWARRPHFARVWTWLVIVGPVGVLFHPWFVVRVVLPMLRAMGAM
jgi:alginate O-acetyltransferase complex protein AlgI